VKEGLDDGEQLYLLLQTPRYQKLNSLSHNDKLFLTLTKSTSDALRSTTVFGELAPLPPVVLPPFGSSHSAAS
jgi:hypothetical protein